MALYLITRTDSVDYDEYDSIVVRAANEKAAMKMATEQRDGPHHYAEFEGFAWDGSNLKIEHVDARGKAEVILSSFNAG